MTTSVPKNESELQQYRVLERANLLQYFDMFISQGGDDVRQLCEAGEDEFLEIMALVGMASKPLHVRRLQKSLQEWLNYPAKFQQPFGEAFPLNVKDEPSLRNNNSVFPCLTETISQCSQTGFKISHKTQISILESVKHISKTIECEPNLDIIEKLNFSCSCVDIEGLFATADLTLSQVELIANQSELLINEIMACQQSYVKEAAKQLCITNPALLTHGAQLYENCIKVVLDSGLDLQHMTMADEDNCSSENYAIKDRIKELNDNIRLLTDRQEATVGSDAAYRNNIAAIQTLVNKLIAERNDLLHCNTKLQLEITPKGMTTLRDDDENSLKIARMEMAS